MSTTLRLVDLVPPVRRSTTTRLPWVVVLAAVLAAVLRLRYLGAPMSPDEGGFLTLARQWSPGSSLYGDYWVDRPPLLITIFKVATVFGGLPALRVLGCLATVATVLAVGATVHRVAGRRAAGWAAAVAGGLLVSPVVGAVAVNGELLAAPFIAGGILLTVLSLRGEGRSRVLYAAGSGAAAVAAVLVKQNMLDVAVFATVLGILAWRTGHVTGRELGGLARWFTFGAVATGVLVLAGAALAGTRPGPLLFALYSFRLRAAGVLASVDPTARLAHLSGIGLRELLAGGVFPVLVLGVLIWTRRRTARSSWHWSVAVATLAATAYALFSVLAGGSYWGHYLIQLVVPTALAAGLVAAALPRLGAVLGAALVLASVTAWTLGQTQMTLATGQHVGDDLREVSSAADTVVPVLGDSDMVETSGMTSPYAYLWSLPARTLDPHFTQLRSALSGSHAPTWVVVRGRGTLAMLHGLPVGRTLDDHYHEVAQLCGRLVYLRNGIERTTPDQNGTCLTPLAGG